MKDIILIMIHIEIKKNQLKDPLVYQAVAHLIQVLHQQSFACKEANVSQSPLSPQGNLASAQVQSLPSRSQKSQNVSQNSIDAPIDSYIKNRYGHIISKKKSLYFMTLIKKFSQINSNQIVKEMRVYYPDFSRKSIGGMTGALKRWFENAQCNIPYLSITDSYQVGIHIFAWIEQHDYELLGLSSHQQSELMKKFPKKHQLIFLKLLTQGYLEREQIGYSLFESFIHILQNLAHHPFTWTEQMIQYHKSSAKSDTRDL